MRGSAARRWLSGAECRELPETSIAGCTNLEGLGMKHYRFLDTLRGFAAMWVVVFHLNETRDWPPSVYQTIVSHGWLGVPIFFVISGFVVQASARRSNSVFGFLSRRFWRIYPPYLASVAIVLGVILGTKLLAGTNDVAPLPVSAVEWLATFGLVTQPLTGRVDLNWVYWSLTYEVAFYLILAATIALPKLRWTIVALLTAAALSRIQLPLFFVDNWTQFGLGLALAEWIRKPTAVSATLAVACTADLITNRESVAAGAAIATAICIWLATHTRTAWLNREDLIRRAGTVSYSLYLIHVPLGVYVFQRVNPWPPGLALDNLAHHVFCDAVVVGLCLACAWVFWRFVEEPAARRFGIGMGGIPATP
jgi:peptidoglycan/LPS O-acetylase OafA/YrhL